MPAFGLEASSAKPLTVTEVTRRIKSLVEANVGVVWVSGEVSNFRRQMPSGHCYFSLKDANAQLRAVMFAGVARGVRFELKDGLEVLANGKVTVYEAYGQHQIVVNRIEPLGKGAAQLALEQLKSRLEAEGLFERARKRPLPRVPRRVAIVTSPSGAALRDMLGVLGKRFPNLEVMIFPCRVQGDEAPGEVRDAVRAAGAWADVDVMIVGRGGGSAEDLWAFNDEGVARAIAASPVPVVSAVGHEVDVTIADLVADKRALTPSEAAELVVPVKADLVADLDQHAARLKQALTSRIELAKRTLDGLKGSAALQRPLDRLQQLQQTMDVNAERLQRAMEGLPRAWKERLDGLEGRLRALTPATRTRNERRRAGDLEKMLQAAITARFATAKEAIGALGSRLDALSPLRVLDRGYSITRNARTGKVVRKAEDVAPGDLLHTRAREASIRSRVDGSDPIAP
ncbi:MAG: exodeoxyribonuclease VII large subunit [Planctomycetota bacterium]